MSSTNIYSIFTLSLYSNVELGKSREKSRNVLICLAQLRLVLCILRLIAGQLAIAFYLETFILCD